MPMKELIRMSVIAFRSVIGSYKYKQSNLDETV